MRRIVLSYFFRIACISLFCYQLFNCLDLYTNQEPVTKTLKRRQEDYIRPLICITALEFDYEGFDNSTKITWKEYWKGRWNTEKFSGEEYWEHLTPGLDDLISSVKVARTKGRIGDDYDLMKVAVTKNYVKDFNEFGLEIVQKDYYHYTKNYCLVLRFSTILIVSIYSITLI